MQTVSVIHRTEQVNVSNGNPVVIQKNVSSLKIPGPTLTIIPFSFVPFFFTATDGQTQFTLPSTPMTNGVIVVAINGIFQSEPKGDFSISGAILTLSDPLDSGDVLTGVYAKTI